MDLDLYTKESPKQIILEDFNVDLPISGGWGYSIDTACVINKNDTCFNNEIGFDAIEIEQIFVEKRIYEEMIIFRSKDEKYSGIRWEIESQKLITLENKKYDHLIFNVIGFTNEVWDELTNRFEAIKKSEQWELMDELNAYRESKSIKFKREYYFEISSFFS
jgi:hypothetical protein